MARNFKVFLHNRTKEKADNLVNDGAIWCDSISGVVEHCTVLFTMLGTSTDVEDVFTGTGGILPSLIDILPSLKEGEAFYDV